MSGAEESRLNTRQRYESQRRADLDEERRLSVRAPTCATSSPSSAGCATSARPASSAISRSRATTSTITEREIGFKKTAVRRGQELSDRLERY